MGFYLSLKDGAYYEGDRQGDDVIVEHRPSNLHVRTNGAWVLGPLPMRFMTSLGFIELFTPEEQLAVVIAAMRSPELRLWYDKLMAADQVVFDDPRLIEGMSVLVAYNLISQSRKEEILNPP